LEQKETPKPSKSDNMPQQKKNKTKILCIFDGFGLNVDSPNNCVSQAKMPTFRRLLKDYKWTTLNADGQSVGQEDGLVGNSEVGHMNIGGLKLVPQLSFQVTDSSQNAFDLDQVRNPNQLFDPKVLLKEKMAKNSVVHLMGLFSTGKIHSDLRHWAGAISAAARAGAAKIVLHLISDGRDSDRKSLTETWNLFVQNHLELEKLKDKIYLGSLGGRFFAMDRDNNVERSFAGISLGLTLAFSKDKELNEAQKGIQDFVVKNYSDQSYTRWVELIHKNKSFVEGIKLIQKLNLSKTELEQKLETQNLENRFEEIPSLLQTISNLHYEKEVYDEMLTPFFFEQISKNETFWLLNFRTDRFKQLGKLLCELNENFELGLTILGMNDFGNGHQEMLKSETEIFRAVNESKSKPVYFPIFKNEPVKNTLAEYISKSKKSQLHIAETEKFNHVTYFLNGGQNLKSQGEDWVVIPSNKVESHAEKPAMKAKEVTDFIVECLDSRVDLVPMQDSQKEIAQSFIRNYWLEIANTWSGGFTKAQEQSFETTLRHVYPTIFGDKENTDQEPHFISYDGEIVGFANFNYYWEKEGYFISDLCVQSEFQPQGIGSKVLEIAKLRGKERGCSQLSLWVDHDNSGAKRLYEKSGFEVNGNRTLNWYDQKGNVTFSSDSYNMIFDLTTFDENVAKHYDYIVVNYANPDMVGHTGDIKAGIESMQVLDTQLARLVQKLEEQGDSMILIADHGNMEFVGEYQKDGLSLTDTEHNDSPVPCVIIDPNFRSGESESENKLLNNLTQSNLTFEPEKLNKSFGKNNNRDYDSEWLSQKEIEELKANQLPLFYAGILLLGL
jgi:bisphosphoglycerate-independent phosphoglycerate mutase (AlkP superfamily)/ribosomal protein S18 acetylase RimI-like enzyme